MRVNRNWADHPELFEQVAEALGDADEARDRDSP